MSHNEEFNVNWTVNFVELRATQINKRMYTYIHASDGDCTIIWYPRVGVKHTWQVYVTSELKIKLFCFFILSVMVRIFNVLENRYCTKIFNNSKRTKTSWNEVMQFTTNNNHSRLTVLKPCPQLGRLWQVSY